jgi:hypothetical protein
MQWAEVSPVVRRTLAAAAVISLLVLGSSCASPDTERDSLAREVPTYLLADLYRAGEHYPVFLALHPQARPAYAAQAALVLAAAGQPPEALTGLAGGTQGVGRWLSAGPDLDLPDAARVLSAAVAAGRRPSTEVVEGYVTAGRAAAASGDLAAAYHASRIAGDLAAAGAPAAGAQVLAALSAGLGPHGCPAGTGSGAGSVAGSGAGTVPLAGRITELSRLLAVAAAVGGTCAYPDAPALLGHVSTWAAVEELLADSDLLEVTSAVTRLVAVGALAADGDVSRFLRAAIDELKKLAARDGGRPCAVDLLAVAGEAARVLGRPMTLPAPLRECVSRVLRWHGLLSEEVDEYDVLSTVYGVRAVDHLAELTGRRDARQLRDRVRARLEPAAAGTGHERVVLGMAFDRAAVAPRDLDDFARQTLTSEIPVHIGLVALAATRAELCTPTVREVLTAHLSRTRAELPAAIEAGSLPYLYWSAVLLRHAVACAAAVEPVAERAAIRDYVSGLLRRPAAYASGGALADPGMARLGWESACVLGVEVPVEQADTVRTALRRWLPASTAPGPAADLPRLYPLLRLIHLVEQGCGPDGSLLDDPGQ